MRTVLLLLATAIAACGAYPGPGGDGEGGGSGGTGADGGSGGHGGAEEREGYPPGPYGRGEGDTIADLAFEAPDGGAFTLGDVYRGARNRVLLVSTAAGWSSECQAIQPELASLYGDYAAEGLAVLVVLFEDASFAPATAEGARDWKERFGSPFPVVADPPFFLGDYYDRAFTPAHLVIEVETMTIVSITTGFDETLLRSSIQTGLDH